MRSKFRLLLTYLPFWQVCLKMRHQSVSFCNTVVKLQLPFWQSVVILMTQNEEQIAKMRSKKICSSFLLLTRKCLPAKELGRKFFISKILLLM